MFTERTEVTMKLTRSHRTVCAGVGLAITVVVAAAPAARADGGGDTLAAVSAATPDTVAAAAAVPTTSAGETAIDATLDGTDVTVPVDPANGITIASEQNSVSIDLPFAADAADEAPRASMMAAPRLPTAGMYSFSYQSMSSTASTARSPFTFALKRSGNIVGE